MTEPIDPRLAQAKVQASPNPMVERTEIAYRVVQEGPVSLAIYDAGGRQVRVLTGNAQSAGDHTLVWDGTGNGGEALPSGVYLARLQNGARSATARVVKLGP